MMVSINRDEYIKSFPSKITYTQLNGDLYEVKYENCPLSTFPYPLRSNENLNDSRFNFTIPIARIAFNSEPVESLKHICLVMPVPIIEDVLVSHSGNIVEIEPTKNIKE